MRYIFVLILMFSLSINETLGQCCAAGNPVNTDFNVGFMSNSLKISTTYRHSLSTEYYRGSTPDTTKYINASSFDFQALEAAYQYKDLNVKALLGYYYAKAQDFDNGYDRTANGWGDLGLSASYNLSKQLKNVITLVPNLGTILPTGTFDQVVDGVVLPIDVQPSAGALRFNGGFLIAKSFVNNKLNIFSYNFMEHSNTIESERTKSYKYGNIYVNTLGTSYGLSNWLSPSFQIRSEYREKSVDKDVVMNSTGGHTVFAALKFNFNVDAFYANAGFDIPIYKNVNGLQLTNKYMASLGIGYRIDFQKIKKTDANLDISKINEMQNLKIEVRGMCVMCTDRIESIALSVRNIKYADYNLLEQSLTIYYTKEPNINVLIDGLKNAGHDTEYGKATDQAYENLHSCCKYERN